MGNRGYGRAQGTTVCGMRHPLHSICPYFAMFPENFVLEQLYAHTRPNDVVLDPFCGRGTTILESLLNNRLGIGSDINPVAACVAGAKADVPELDIVLDRVDELSSKFSSAPSVPAVPSEFFARCFHPDTFAEIGFLRRVLAWRADPVDRFIAALVLGALHGESHRSEMYLSNRMPRTISTKPDYSVKWWKSHNLLPPRRATFDVLRQAIYVRYSQRPPSKKGKVVLKDARHCGLEFPEHAGSVALVVTSPPYIDTTDYAEDQWLRLWFLGGEPRPVLRLYRDDRHTQMVHYWTFLQEVWSGCASLLRDTLTIVVRIGGRTVAKRTLLEGLETSLSKGLPGRVIRPLHDGISSKIANRQTNSFRPGTSAHRSEHDFTFLVS
jgi:DNA methylase